jgi:hypothetical protein
MAAKDVKGKAARCPRSSQGCQPKKTLVEAV